MYCGYITRIKNVKKHSNADRLQVGDCFDSQVIVSLTTQEGDIGIFFADDGKLGQEFAEENNLLRKKDENGKEIGGYLDPDKRNIRAISLRGERSEGIFLSLKSLEKFTDISKLKEGDQITVLNGIVICEKYVPRTNSRARKEGEPNSKGKKGIRPVKLVSYPLFSQHVDTGQLQYNKGKFKEGDLCYITAKFHGSSARISNTVRNSRKYYSKPILKLRKLLGFQPKITQEWHCVSGSRRVILDEFDNSGYYGTNEFRKKWHDILKENLHKGESIFFEIVGWVNDAKTIMPTCSNKKLKNNLSREDYNEFIRQYGDTTTFSYGCEQGESDIFVYRMNITNQDGYTIEYPTELVQQRCEEMGIKHVPVLEKFMFTTLEDLEQRVEKHTDGCDPVGKTHIREGIVVRIDNRKRFNVFKHKSYTFKVLEGIIKDQGISDIEELDGEENEG